MLSGDNLKHLDLSGYTIDSSDVKLILALLENCSYITELTLDAGSSFDLGCENIYKLATSRNLCKLNAGLMRITTDWARKIAEECKLEKLSVFGHDSIVISKLNEIAIKLAQNKYLKSIKINSAMDDNGLAALLTSKNLQNIEIRGSCINLTEKGLADLIANNTTLRKIAFLGSRIKGALAKEGLASFGRNRSIESLSFSSSYLADDGCIALAKGLKSNSTLKHLTLWNCGIYNIGVEELMLVLQNNNTLQKLSLGLNAFSSGISGNLAWNTWNSSGISSNLAWKRITDMLEVNKTLKSLDFIGISINKDDIAILRTALDKRGVPLEDLKIDVDEKSTTYNAINTLQKFVINKIDTNNACYPRSSICFSYEDSKSLFAKADEHSQYLIGYVFSNWRRKLAQEGVYVPTDIFRATNKFLRIEL